MMQGQLLISSVKISSSGALPMYRWPDRDGQATGQASRCRYKHGQGLGAVVGDRYTAYGVHLPESNLPIFDEVGGVWQRQGHSGVVAGGRLSCAAFAGWR
jgi:hypothetical protein